VSIRIKLKYMEKAASDAPILFQFCAEINKNEIPACNPNASSGSMESE
jgi:hypothetical protein